MKYSSLLAFIVFISLEIHGMDQEQRKKVFMQHMAHDIQQYGVCIQTQKNHKKVYAAALVINGKIRTMKARFYVHGQIDEAYGDCGVQWGPVVS